MIFKIISGVLILVTAFLCVKHGWEALTIVEKSGQPGMIAVLGIGKITGQILGAITLAIGIMILFPQTFFIANLLNAMTILLIMALALKTGNMKIAFLEIPFLLIPLVLIYLGYPLKK